MIKSTNLSKEAASPLSPHLEMLKGLPLFAGVDAGALRGILQYARVTDHEKGDMIFMQGERATRFYIILEGFVKLFKGNADGAESILQILTTGEMLLETAIFNDAPFPVSAQAVDGVKLLSIPATIIRKNIADNKALASNMLAEVAGRSQALITQFEQVTLKNAVQRIGWFLLKLSLQNGGGAGEIKLPYDKSLIAGYLGMKPETFSRTLQILKEQGVDVERGTVSLTNAFALCAYCDTDLATKCSRAGSDACPNPDCI